MENDFFIFEILIVLLAGFFHGIVGFGFPMIATPLFVLFLDLKQAVLYTLFPTLVTNVVSLKKANSFSDIWQRFWLLILSVMIGSIVGTYLLVAYYSHYYKLILAGVMLLYLNKERLHLSLTRAVAEQKNMTTIIMGVLSGLVGGMANIMSPVLIMLILEFKLDKKRAIGVMSFCFIANKTLQILIFGYHGSFNMENSALIMLFVFISLIGFWIGNKIHERIDEKLYTAILNKILWVISFYLIYSTFYM
ncbi:hypothetical protein SJPD1_0295 [Sulfurospirillum diekertiae]|uniref:Probable membrane transporter protein n=1 Tax=Sulfurospirillum diekertiae TaxID=1854492 RepID=A0A290HP50_9BACT|nr:sulfite exporter TauE/SafE family protein [Sulfurospirillum diekertiae]ATB68424.1 hypothetical protein SJPD1_0295 [Sulfurospirillum diekertiae]